MLVNYRGAGLLACWLVGLVLVHPPRLASANSGGIAGYSGKQNQNTTCNNCHGGGQFPDVTLEGPTQMLPGAVGTFRFTVEANPDAPSQRSAGLNVAAGGGVLGTIQGQGTNLIQWPPQSGIFELTHAGAKPNTSGAASWQFTWTAPSTPGAYVIYAAGNSVNRSGNTLGDRGDTDVLNVFVMAVEDTATPTATAVPATETETPAATATATIEATSTRRDTPTSTATRTHSAIPSATPTPTETPTPTATPTQEGPSPGDANCDGAINAADLAATLRLMEELEGEVGACVFADANCDEVIDEEDLVVLFSRVFGGPIAEECEDGE